MPKATGGKFYAVKVGRKTGIFRTWTDCEAQVKQFSGGIFKSFPTRAEANAYLQTEIPEKAKSNGVHEKTKSNGAKSEKNISYLQIYTDGACVGNGKRDAKAGFGVFFGLDDPRNIGAPLPSTIIDAKNKPTNNRAEMYAVIHALETVSQHQAVVINTDSKYVKDGITKWIGAWKERKWATTLGTSVLNVDLWKRLDAALCARTADTKWCYVPGHSGHFGNEFADRLARSGAAKNTASK